MTPGSGQIRPIRCADPSRLPRSRGARTRVLYLANSDWYLHNFQRDLIRRVAEAGGEPVLATPDGRHRGKLEEAGFRWVEVPMRRTIAPFADVRTLLALIRLYRRERPTIVHHFTTKGVVYGTAAALLCRVPAIVNTINGLGYVFGSGNVAARIIRPFLAIALRALLRPRHVRVLFHNRDDMQAFLEAGIVPRDRAVDTPGSGVNTDRFRPGERAEGQPVRVLMASRLLWEKGVGEFVEAARRLRHENLDASFWLAGSRDPGNPGSIPEAVLERWRREGAVRFLGHRDDMPELLRDVDLFVLPTYREGAPRALLEAAASGLAVVATDTPGCRDLVASGSEGVLVPPRDGEALGDAIAGLVGDELARRRLGRRARARAVRQFDIGVVFDRTLEQYHRALDRPVRAERRFGKRLFDMVVSSLGLLTLSPLWALIALAIKLEDGGPVLFRQTRWGREGSRFEVFKFRTMRDDSTGDLRPATEDDPRITRVGRLLRATALDELPQLVNILRGDMSVVGPRPLAVGEVQPDGSRYEAIPGFEYRLSVRPGLTSIAAIYLPKDASPRRKFAYDRLYVRRCGLALDLRLIARSFWITFRGKWESRERREIARGPVRA